MNKIELARNPNTPPEVLEVLATDEDWTVRHEAAQNPNATELIRRLFLMNYFS